MFEHGDWRENFPGNFFWRELLIGWPMIFCSMFAHVFFFFFFISLLSWPASKLSAVCMAVRRPVLPSLDTSDTAVRIAVGDLAPLTQEVDEGEADDSGSDASGDDSPACTPRVSSYSPTRGVSSDLFVPPAHAGEWPSTLPAPPVLTRQNAVAYPGSPGSSSHQEHVKRHLVPEHVPYNSEEAAIARATANPLFALPPAHLLREAEVARELAEARTAPEADGSASPPMPLSSPAPPQTPPTNPASTISKPKKAKKRPAVLAPLKTVKRARRIHLSGRHLAEMSRRFQEVMDVLDPVCPTCHRRASETECIESSSKCC